MIIATYNLWNSDEGMPDRESHIIDEIRKASADILCLQEVRDEALAMRIAEYAGYTNCFFDHYPGEDEGLCILSRLQFDKYGSVMGSANAVYGLFNCENKRIGVINAHLPYYSEAERERQIVCSVNAANMLDADAFYLAGDLNCGDTSDVQRFLKGDCLLGHCEAKPRWFDLALAYAELTSTSAEPTLNFRRNPRFRHNTIETNARVDCIWLRNTYPQGFPELKNCMLFGQHVYEDIALAASDHYGVAVEIE